MLRWLEAHIVIDELLAAVGPGTGPRIRKTFDSFPFLFDFSFLKHKHFIQGLSPVDPSFELNELSSSLI